MIFLRNSFLEIVRDGFKFFLKNCRHKSAEDGFRSTELKMVEGCLFHKSSSCDLHLTEAEEQAVKDLQVSLIIYGSPINLTFFKR